MTPIQGNPFLRGLTGRRPLSLASALAPLQARLERFDGSARLTLTPIRAVDLSVIFPAIRANTQAPAAQTLLLGSGLPSGTVAEGDTLIAGHPVFDDLGFAEVLSTRTFEELRAVRIAGPVEVRDVAALANAAERGDSLLDFECRAVVSVHLRGDRVLEMDVRDEEIAYALVAEHFRHYLAALCNRPVGHYALPEAALIASLLADDQGITVRPIESDIFSTFVDIGICTTADDPQGPAERSLIYDRVSHTWHGED